MCIIIIISIIIRKSFSISSNFSSSSKYSNVIKCKLLSILFYAESVKMLDRNDYFDYISQKN